VERVNDDSWRITSAVASPTLHATLFVRDAFQLKPDDEPVIPPRLSGHVPDLSRLVSNFDVREAAIAWTPWFERALDFEFDAMTGRVDVGAASDAARARFFDPPEFNGLWAWPALQAAARASHREALRWNKFHATLSSEALHHSLRDSVVSSVAWETCAALHVSPARLRATVLVLDVEGTWSAHPHPGVLLCSANVARKASLLKDGLRETFLEALRADSATEITPVDGPIAWAAPSEPGRPAPRVT
jgi:hypothetical protein